MESHAFDRLTRRMATAPTRRRLIGGLVAGAFGLVGLRSGEARTCTDAGRVCREHAKCCSGLCGPKDATGRRRCGCRTITDCPAASVCWAVACQEGVCVTTATPGVACDDGDRCTADTRCTATGHCVGTPVVCKPQDDCHQATCDRATGECRQIPLTDTPCDDGTACTTEDTCQDGTCVGGPALNCLDGQVCDPLLGCVCSTSEGCPAERECFHGGCFLPNPSFSSQICVDACGPSNIGLLGGISVCVGEVGGACSSHTDCPVGQACHDCPVPPCLLSCLSPC
jgi:hypothetical protein